MAYTINTHQAKTHLSKLLERVKNGEQIIIARAGKPIAVLSPYKPPPKDRIPGMDAGKVRISEHFDEPLPEFEDL
jgi:prevent-host-death family protein